MNTTTTKKKLIGWLAGGENDLQYRAGIHEVSKGEKTQTREGVVGKESLRLAITK